MTTKSDWEAVGPNMTTGGRRTPGEPPTTDELLAHGRGELSGADAERVRVWLEANPDMARALTQPFPEDDAKPGDPDYLPEEEVSRRLAALKKEIRPAGRVMRFPVWTALAAALAVVFAGLYAYEVRQSRLPSLFTPGQELEPAGRARGTSASAQTIDVTQRENDFLLKLTDAEQYPFYRIEIWPAAGDPGDPLWASEPTQPRNERLEMTIPRKFLRPGFYRVKVFGLEERTSALVDQYLVRVPPR